MRSLEALLDPNRLMAGSAIAADRKLVPAEPGVYGWFFDEVPDVIPTTGCKIVDGGTLLYAGISPSAPPKSGKAPSAQTLRARIGYHLTGNAYGSTLRLTVGCLLGYGLRRIASTKNPGTATRITFGPQERALSEWMEANMRVSWFSCGEPW